MHIARQQAIQKEKKMRTFLVCRYSEYFVHTYFFDIVGDAFRAAFFLSLSVSLTLVIVASHLVLILKLVIQVMVRYLM